jgi:hypothetical protein
MQLQTTSIQESTLKHKFSIKCYITTIFWAKKKLKLCILIQKNRNIISEKLWRKTVLKDFFYFIGLAPKIVSISASNAIFYPTLNSHHNINNSKLLLLPMNHSLEVNNWKGELSMKNIVSIFYCWYLNAKWKS